MLKRVVSFSNNNYLKSSQIVRTGVTEVNNTKSRAKFSHVAFSLVFIGVFRLFGSKCGYSLRYWELKNSAKAFWMTLHECNEILAIIRGCTR